MGDGASKEILAIQGLLKKYESILAQQKISFILGESKIEIPSLFQIAKHFVVKEELAKKPESSPRLPVDVTEKLAIDERIAFLKVTPQTHEILKTLSECIYSADPKPILQKQAVTLMVGAFLCADAEVINSFLTAINEAFKDDIGFIQNFYDRALLRVSAVGSVKGLELLIKLGANSNYSDSKLRTALHYACLDNQNETANAILSINPKLIDLQDRNGRTAIHIATEKGNSDLISILLKYKPSVSSLAKIRDFSGIKYETPYSLADKVQNNGEREKIKKLIN